MSRHSGLALILIACVALGACRLPKFGGDKAPTGQVVATVDGREITLRELQAEMAGVNIPDPKLRKAAQQEALRSIIARKLVAEAARKQGIDKTPDFALQRQRATDALLAQALEAKVAKQVPAPTRDEAERFVTDHPDIFAERKIWAVDQIRIARPGDVSVLNQLKPLDTMDQIQAWLVARRMAYRRGDAALDTVGADPRIVEGITKLPASEVFVIPSGNLVLINQIKATRVVPFTGEPAVKYAMELLKRQRIQEAVGRQMSAIVTKGAATVRYNKDFAPPKAPLNPAAKPTRG